MQEAEATFRSAETLVKIARAGVERADNHLRYLGLTPEQLPEAADEHAVEGQGAHEEAHLIEVRSPIAGTIIERTVSAGAVVTPSDSLYVISDLRSLWVIAQVPEQHLSLLRSGLTVEVSVRAYPGKAFPARITTIGDALDPETRTVEVRCELNNPGRQLKTEMFATLTIHTGGSREAVVAPLEALQNVDGEEVVFVPEGRVSFRARRVRVGRHSGSVVEIVSGLQAGEKVVVSRRLSPQVRAAESPNDRRVSNRPDWFADPIGICNMLKRIIDYHLDHPWVVLFGLVVLVAAGLSALYQTPIDAFPDLTNNQVTVITEAPGMAPVEVEQLVTFPIESSMMGLPYTEEVRSISKLGLSMVTIVFADSVDNYFARQLVNERLNEARGRIPAGLEPALGPVATAFGEVYRYTLEGEGYSPMELKTLHDWEIKYQLQAVPGVADINTWGGHTRQYEIEVDPYRLHAHGLTLRDVFERVRGEQRQLWRRIRRARLRAVHRARPGPRRERAGLGGDRPGGPPGNSGLPA